jgi:ABC-type multidrug transport system fused ATPase/permease subunit
MIQRFYSFIQNTKNLIEYKNIRKLFFLLILYFFNSVLEFFSLATIPLMLSIILDKELFLSKINIDFIKIFITSHETSDLIFFLSFFIITIFVVKNILLFLIGYFHGIVTKNIKIHISNKIYSYYLKSNHLLSEKENSSVVQRVIFMDIGNVSTFFYLLITIFRDILILLSVCFLIISVDSFLFILVAALSSVSYLFFIFTKKKLLIRGYLIQNYTSNLIKYINETIAIIKEIKIYHLENLRLSSFSENISVNEKNSFKNFIIQTVPRLLLETFGIIIIVSTILVFVFLKKDISEFVPFIGLLVVSTIRLIPVIGSLNSSMGSLSTTTASFNKVVKIANDLLIEKKEKISIFKNFIELKNISFKYKYKNILDCVSLKIYKNDKIGIVGKSGAGKTTLINIILGLLPVNGGNIIIDNKKIRKNFVWKNNIGYVPQEVFLIDDTIKNNIILGSATTKINEADLIRSAKLAQLHDFIMELPDKYNTIVGERGSNLSVGQRQRLGVARALFVNPKLLVLDESSNSLDKKTEKRFIEDIFRACRNITIIFISHNLKSLSKCNKIYDLEKSKFI